MPHKITDTKNTEAWFETSVTIEEGSDAAKSGITDEAITEAVAEALENIGVAGATITINVDL